VPEPCITLHGSSVSDWLADQLPVLLVFCQVTGQRVASAHFAWIDAAVYGQLGWPIEVDTLQGLCSVRISLSERFTVRSRQALLSYLECWASVHKTAKNVDDYIADRSRRILAASTIRRGLFQWSLFSLPISFEQRPRASKPKVITPKELFCATNRRIAILGKPATGKTITVQRLIARPPGKSIPILINDSLPANVEQIIQRICRAVGIASRDHFNWLEWSGRLLLIVDGLNEFTDYDAVAKNLRALAEALPNSALVVTCRTADYRGIDGIQEWEIRELDKAAQGAFLDSQPPPTSAAVCDAFTRQPRLQAECSNQFLFLLAVELIPKLKGATFSRTELYRTFIERHLRWEHIERLERQRLINLLAKIAFTMRQSQRERTSMPNSKLVKLLALEVGPDDAEHLKRKLYRHGMIETNGRTSRFFQETLQEYLCAQYLVNKGILPCHFAQGQNGFSYDGVRIDGVIKSFYAEIGGFGRLFS
jgi:predicted NACHT family NTPase